MKDIPIDRGAFSTIEQNSLINGPTSRPSFESLHSVLSLYMAPVPVTHGLNSNSQLHTVVDILLTAIMVAYMDPLHVLSGWAL